MSSAHGVKCLHVCAHVLAHVCVCMHVYTLRVVCIDCAWCSNGLLVYVCLEGGSGGLSDPWKVVLLSLFVRPAGHVSRN